MPPRIIDQLRRAAVIEQVVSQVLPATTPTPSMRTTCAPWLQPTVDVTEIPNVTGAQGGQPATAEVDVVPAFELPEIDEKLVVASAH